MRYIDPTLKARLEKAHQTLYENAQPAMDIWISRNSTPIQDPMFWERTKINDITSVTALSAAARRTDIKFDADRIYVAYCKNTNCYFKYSTQRSDVSKMIWLDVEETIPDVVDVSLAFDGKMVNDIKGRVEFQTESSPWVFWCNAAGEAYGKIIGDDSTKTLLVIENCSKVSAIRGVQSDVAGVDQGLLLFFILNGSIYYRAYTLGEWQESRPINFGPSVTWVDIKASRTWDFRIVIQAMDSNGHIYELFTFTEGLAKKNIERITVKKIDSEAEIIPIKYSDSKLVENIGISDISATSESIYALSPVPVSIVNIDDGNGDWGKLIVVEFDYAITNIDGSAPCFLLTDRNGNAYTAQSIEFISDSSIMIRFLDFNQSYQTECTLTYTPGEIQGPAVSLETFSTSFIPVNLVKKEPGKPISITNVSSREIIVEFDSRISSSDLGALADALSISGQEYNYVPDGAIVDKVYEAATVAILEDEAKKLKLILTGLGRLKAPVGEVTVSYNSTLGNLMSGTGAVLSFDISFTPTGLTIVNNPNAIELIEIPNIEALSNYIRVYYSTASLDENMTIANVTALGSLKNINDL